MVKIPIHLNRMMYRLKLSLLTFHYYLFVWLIFFLFFNLATAQDSVFLLKKLAASDPPTRELAFKELGLRKLNQTDHNFIRQLFTTVDQAHILRKELNPDIQIQIERITDLLIDKQKRITDPTIDLSPAAISLIYTLSVNQSAIRKRALSALSNYHELTLAFQLLNHPEAVVRQNIAYALGELNFQSEDEKFVSDLIKAMKKPNLSVQGEVILALAKMKLSSLQKEKIINELVDLYREFKFYLPHELQSQLTNGNKVKLLNLPDRYSSDLDNSAVLGSENGQTTPLSRQLKMGGLQVSPQTTIRIIRKGKQWQIIDPSSRQIYRVLAIPNDGLSVFRDSLQPILVRAFNKEGILLDGEAKVEIVPVINDSQMQSTAWLLTNFEPERRYYILHQTEDFRQLPEKWPQANLLSSSPIAVLALHSSWEIRRKIILTLSKIGQKIQTDEQNKKQIISFLLSCMSDPHHRVCQAIARNLKAFTRPNIDLTPAQVIDQGYIHQSPYDFENLVIDRLGQYLNLVPDPAKQTKMEEKLQFYSIMALGEIGHPSHTYIDRLIRLRQENDKLKPLVTSAIGQIMSNEYQVFTLPDMISPKSIILPKNIDRSKFSPKILDQLKSNLTKAETQILSDAHVQVRRRNQVWSIVDQQGQEIFQIQKQTSPLSYQLFRKNNFADELDDFSRGDRKSFNDSQLEKQFRLVNLSLPKKATVKRIGTYWSIFDSSKNGQLFCQIRPLEQSTSSQLAVYFRLKERMVDDVVLSGLSVVFQVKTVVDSLRREIKGGRKESRFIDMSASLSALGKIGPNAKRDMNETEFDSLVSDVTNTLNHKSTIIRRNGLICLDKITDGDKFPEPTINQLSLLALQDKQNRHLAIQILATQKDNAEQALTALKQVLKEGDERTQGAILTAFPHIDPAGTVEILLEYLQEDMNEISVRVAAAYALADSISALRDSGDSEKQNREPIKRIVIDLLQATTNTVPAMQAAAEKTLSRVVTKDFETEEDLVSGFLKGLLFSVHSKSNQEPDFMILPQFPTKEKVLQYLDVIDQLQEKPSEKVLINAARIFAQATEKSSRNNQRHLHSALFTFSRQPDFQAETVKIFLSLDWTSTLDFLRSVIEGNEKDLGRPINSGDRQHALNMLGKVVNSRQNDKANLDVWGDIVPIIIEAMIDEEQIIRKQQEIRRQSELSDLSEKNSSDWREIQKQIDKLKTQVDVHYMAAKVWGNVIALKPEMTVETLFILTQEQRFELETQTEDSLRLLERLSNNSRQEMSEVVSDLLQKKKVSLLLSQYKNSIELLKGFVETSDFLLKRLSPNKAKDKDVEQRKHALRFLVFPKQLLVPNIEGQPAPTEKLIAKLQTVLTQHPDDELKSDYRKALTRLGQ